MRKITAEQLVSMVDFDSGSHGINGPMNHFDELKGWYGKDCNVCNVQLNQIAESLSLDGTDVDGSEKIYHVQWMHKGEWNNTFWHPDWVKLERSKSYRMSFDEASASLALACEYFPSIKFRIHADRVVE